MCRCGGASEHDHITQVTVTKSLFPYILPERTSVLNVKNPECLCKSVLREKFFNENNNGDLKSEVDDQILINVVWIVRFSGTVKLKGIDFFGSTENSSKWPTKLKVYANAPSVDFGSIEMLPVSQEFSLCAASSAEEGPVRYATRAAKFFNVNNLVLLFEKAQDGGASIELNFIGFEGEFSQSRVGAVKTEYESKPMVTDHKALEEVKYFNNN